MEENRYSNKFKKKNEPVKEKKNKSLEAYRKPKYKNKFEKD
jgi:hypothetical protein